MTKNADSVQMLQVRARSSVWVGSAAALFCAGLSGCFGDGQRQRDPARLGSDPWAAPAATRPATSASTSASTSDAPGIDLGTGSNGASARSVGIDDSAPAEPLVPLSSIDLTGLFPADAKLVGIAVSDTDPDAPPYVLEARTGLYEIARNEAKLVFDLRASRVLAGTGDGSPPSELTDVTFDGARSAESGVPSFLVTGENDGYSLTLPGASITSYFCYLPPITSWSATATPSVSQEYRQQGIAVSERTEAVAISELSAQIFAQPRTTRIDSADVVGSELFAFGTQGGQPTGSQRLERTDFAAGGAVFLAANTLWLGSGAGLYFTGGWTENIRLAATVQGVDTITGMAVSAEGHLLVLDGPQRRLLELDSTELAALANGSAAP